MSFNGRYPPTGPKSSGANNRRGGSSRGTGWRGGAGRGGANRGGQEGGRGGHAGIGSARQAAGRGGHAGSGTARQAAGRAGRAGSGTAHQRAGRAGSGFAHNSGHGHDRLGGVPQSGEVEMERPRVEENPEAFIPHDGYVHQAELPEASIRVHDVYCPNCLEYKSKCSSKFKSGQPWQLELCEAPCGTCRQSHAGGFCPHRWCTWSYYKDMPRKPYVNEGIRIQPTAVEAAKLASMGYPRFEGFVALNEARGHKRAAGELSAGGREKRMKQEISEWEQRYNQTMAGWKSTREEKDRLAAKSGRLEAENDRFEADNERLAVEVAELKQRLELATKTPLPAAEPGEEADLAREEDDLFHEMEEHEDREEERALFGEMEEHEDREEERALFGEMEEHEAKEKVRRG